MQFQIHTLLPMAEKEFFLLLVFRLVEQTTQNTDVQKIYGGKTTGVHVGGWLNGHGMPCVVSSFWLVCFHIQKI